MPIVGLLGIVALGRSSNVLRTDDEDRAVPATRIHETRALLLYDPMALAQALQQPTPDDAKPAGALDFCRADF